eukprot:scaffold67716_cov26-Tisochrysis_lutea.AAC.1
MRRAKRRGKRQGEDGQQRKIGKGRGGERGGGRSRRSLGCSLRSSDLSHPSPKSPSIRPPSRLNSLSLSLCLFVSLGLSDFLSLSSSRCRDASLNSQKGLITKVTSHSFSDIEKITRDLAHRRWRFALVKQRNRWNEGEGKHHSTTIEELAIRGFK